MAKWRIGFLGLLTYYAKTAALVSWPTASRFVIHASWNFFTDDGYDSEEDTLCRGKDDDDCSFQFRYRYVEKVLTVWGQRKKECGANVWAVVFGLIGATVLIGLLFIIVWKVLTTIHDQREYAKFEKERAQSKWDRVRSPFTRTGEP
uniref:Integrin beta subunit cytoplasmic domain-containing protein n=1 Tax=Timema poppense TaxID=170557 RepID=A0A7R9H7M0_TIMPO|nr:unnamed protein product [Timema poppensis]